MPDAGDKVTQSDRRNPVTRWFMPKRTSSNLTIMDEKQLRARLDAVCQAYLGALPRLCRYLSLFVSELSVGPLSPAILVPRLDTFLVDRPQPWI